MTKSPERRISRHVIRLVIGIALWLAVSQAIVESFDLRFFQPQAEPTMRKVEVFREQAPTFDVIFLGSSRTRRALVPQTFEEEVAPLIGRELTAFNLGVNATMMPSYTIIARNLLHGDHRPSMLVLGLGARSFNSNSPRYDHTIRHLCGPLDLLGAYGPHLTSGDELLVVPEVMFRATSSLIQLWRRGTDEEVDLAKGIWELGGATYPALTARKSLPLMIDDSDLRSIVPASEYRAQQVALAKATRYRIGQARRVLLEDYDVDGRCTTAFRELIDICRERSIRLVVLNLPVTEAFAKGAYVDGEYDAYLTRLRELCTEGAVPLFDLNRPPYRPPTFFFRDGDHLTREGAWYFTRLVTREVLANLLKE
ncbi:MAG: SGNH/GDSL hydrolase family protein [Planctomycetota bacterium]